jgi:hypothetical protein
VSSLPWFGWFTVNELLKLKSNGSQGWHNHRISFVYLKAPRLLPLREIMKCTSKKEEVRSVWLEVENTKREDGHVIQKDMTRSV